MCNYGVGDWTDLQKGLDSLPPPHLSLTNKRTELKGVMKKKREGRGEVDRKEIPQAGVDRESRQKRQACQGKERERESHATTTRLEREQERKAQPDNDGSCWLVLQTLMTAKLKHGRGDPRSDKKT